MMRHITHPFVALLICLVCAWLGVWFWEHTAPIAEINKEVEAVEARAQRAQAQADLSRQQVEKAASPLERERIIRDELLSQKPGEVVFQLPPIPSTAPVVPPPSPNITPWQEWQAVFLEK